MRGVLATTIMLYHFGLVTAIAALTGGRISDGQWGLAVDFFFLLSGFVLCRSFVRRQPGLGEYSLKRVLRLAPMFLLTTLAVLAVADRSQWSGTTILANLAMVQSLIGLRSVNFPAWSIPFELFLPFAGVLATGAAIKLRPTPLVVLFGITLGVQAWALLLFTTGQDVAWLRAATGLAGGWLLFLLHRTFGFRHGTTATVVSTAAFVALMLIMLFTGVAPSLALAFPPLGCVSIWFGAEARGPFSTAPLQALGRWSYSIYLLHIPVLLAVAGAGVDLDGDLRGKLVVMLGVIGLAGFTYRFIEAPFINLGRRFQAAPHG